MTIKQQEETLALLKRVKKWCSKGEPREDAAELLPDVLPVLERLIKEASG